MGLTIFYRTFLTFRLNVKNIPHITDNPTKHYYESE